MRNGTEILGNKKKKPVFCKGVIQIKFYRERTKRETKRTDPEICGWKNGAYRKKSQKWLKRGRDVTDGFVGRFTHVRRSF